MACLFLDSFDHYATADITRKWNNPRFSTINFANARTGPACLSADPSGCSLTIANTQTLIAGTAYKTQSDGGFIIGFYDGNPGQVYVNVEGGTQRLQVLRGTPGATSVVLATTAIAIQLNIYYRVEFKATIAPGVGGSFELRLNGVVVASGAGVNTSQTGTAYANEFRLGAGGGGLQSFHDDVYLCDNSGAVNNDFMGDIVVIDNTPNADGIYQEWTPLVGVNHFAMVNEIPPDNNVTYCSSSTIGQRDTYKFPATGILPGSAVLALQLNIDAEKDIAGNRVIAPLIRQAGAGADFVGNNFPISQDPSYVIFHQPFDVNPVTGVSWLLSDLTAAEFGQQVTG